MLTINTYDLQNNSDFEEILGFKFTPTDVLKTKSEKNHRKANLINAATLDSISPTRVLIHLLVNEQEKCIKSCVKAVGNQQIIVGRGFAIPIHAIFQVEIIPAA